MHRRLVMFDMDNTLLAGDSEHAWGEFLGEVDRVGGARQRQRSAAFYRAHQAGALPVADWLAFAAEPFNEHAIEQLEAWRDIFMARKIAPMRLPAASALVERHRAMGDTLLIVTATNDFIARPIAASFGIEHLLATELRTRDGALVGQPCFQEGKIWHVERWIARHGGSWDDSMFYSDSHNDMPLLMRVDCPVAVDPDPTLRQRALALGWSALTLRAGPAPTALA